MRLATMMTVGWGISGRLALLAGVTLALLLPATRAEAVPLALTVTSAADTSDINPGDGVCDAGGGAGSACTLRAAIEEANASVDGASIGFALTGGTVIAPASPLPVILSWVSIDGTTQACAEQPCVTLDGASAGANAAGLVLAANESDVTALVVLNFGGAGITLAGGDINVRASHIGHAGGVASPNAVGVRVEGDSTSIGTAGEGNVVSGNLVGIELAATANGTSIAGNFIGTDAAGTTAIGNTVAGIRALGTNAQIGASGDGAGNLISGNAVGVIISAETSFAKIQHNRIGTNLDGTGAIANGVGVRVVDSTDALVGGTGASEGNVIAGNATHGVVVEGDASFGNTIAGNIIGLNGAGDAALGNGGDGVHVVAPVTDTVIGGTVAGARNVISGNGGAGIMLAGADFSLVQGNYIGLNAAGTATIGQQAGIAIDAGDDNVIGGFSAAAANVIAGNGDGVRMINGAKDNLVYRNIIGARPNGTTAAPNITGVAIASGATANRVGAPGEGNLIAFNTGDGVVVDGAAALGNRVRANSIHSNGGAAIDLTNGGNGGILPPVITTVGAAGVGGVACSGCTIDVFSDAADEARTLVGSVTATIGGSWALMVEPGGPNVTATATDTLGDTSEVALWDTDGDGIGNGYPAPIDNCAGIVNASQTNTDAAALTTPGGVDDVTVAMSDALGDACDDDDDNDGILDLAEPSGCNASGPLDPRVADTDGDRTRDGAECAMGTNPGSAASKPPGIAPGEGDNDGLADALEVALGSNPTDSDSDDDGMSDGLEFRGYSTSPTATNSDGDGCPDDTEIASLNLDRVVNALDLVIVATNFLVTSKPAVDVNKDGTINALDLVLVASNFTVTPCPA